MPDYRLSTRAAADLDQIANYTIEQFGIEQARRYRNGLEGCFATIAGNPLLGRSAQVIAPNLRRFEHGSHVIFYKPLGPGVLIVRVLHESLDAPSHF